MEQSSTLQDVLSAFELGIMSATVYLTVVSGYLIVAYTAGANLNRTQLIIVSALFIVFAVLFAWGTYGFFDLGFKIVDPSLSIGFTETYLPIVLFLAQLVGVVAALRFMSDIRKNEKK